MENIIGHVGIKNNYCYQHRVNIRLDLHNTMTKLIMTLKITTLLIVNTHNT
jgi:hypothetical protein